MMEHHREPAEFMADLEKPITNKDIVFAYKAKGHHNGEFRYKTINGELQAVIKRGTYWVGNGYWPDSCRHEYFIASDILVDVFPVTIRDFTSFVRSGGYFDDKNWTDGAKTREKGADAILRRIGYRQNHQFYPVTNVSWYEAKAYSKWRRKRLLLEKEWEICAEGTLDKKLIPEIQYIRAFFSRSNPVFGRSIPEIDLSFIGAAKMLSLVREWVNDWYNPSSFIYFWNKVDHNSSETIPVSLNRKCVKGIQQGVIPVRTADYKSMRDSTYPDEYDTNIGFRCCVDLKFV